MREGQIYSKHGGAGAYRTTCPIPTSTGRVDVGYHLGKVQVRRDLDGDDVNETLALICLRQLMNAREYGFYELAGTGSDSGKGKNPVSAMSSPHQYRGVSRYKEKRLPPGG